MDPLAAPPTSFPAGTTLKVTCSYGNFPANDGWALAVFLSNGDVSLPASTIVTNADGASFDVTFAAGDTAPLAPGFYRWVPLSTKDGESFDPLAGERIFIEVEPNLTVAAAGTFLSPEEKELATLNDLIAGRITDDVQAYTIDGTAATLVPIERLWKRQAYLKRVIARRRSPGAFAEKILINYTRLGGH